MMKFTTSAAALGAALLISVAGTTPSFAKAHDQGLATGTENNKNADKAGRFGGSTPDAAQTLGEKMGRSENSGMKQENGSQPSSDTARSAAD